jgi:hypothetical protein
VMQNGRRIGFLICSRILDVGAFARLLEINGWSETGWRIEQMLHPSPNRHGICT